MGIPLRQSARLAHHLVRQTALGREKFPLIVELEPLFACNQRCPGCGKTYHPPEVLARRMTVDQALTGMQECGAPMVSIAGGEPLLHREIDTMVETFIHERLFVYLCTNGLLARERLGEFRPSPYLSWVFHVDGLEARHDRSVARPGAFHEIVAAIREAKARGFRVNTNSTFFTDDSPEDVIALLDFLTFELKVDAVMVSPAFAQTAAADQDRFLADAATRRLFSEVFSRGQRRRWPLNHSPVFLDFLEGRLDLPCMPWAIPSFSVLGWQRPCYLLADGYAESYDELIETTDWSRYGRGLDPRCAGCMAHCGHEPSAVRATMRSPLAMVRALRR